FQPDKIAKEEALKVTHGKMRNTPVVLDIESKAKPVSRREEESSEILIKGVQTADADRIGTKKKEKVEEKPAPPKVEPEVIKAKAEKIEGPKVLDKIELTEEVEKSKGKKKTKKEKEEEEKKAAKEAAAKKKEEKKKHEE